MGCMCSTKKKRQSSQDDDECSSNLGSENGTIPNGDISKGACEPWLSRATTLPDCSRYRKKKRQPCVSELAMAMHRAEFTAAAVIGVPSELFLTQQRTNDIIRQAKAEGSAIKVIDGHLYIDLKHVGRVPPGVKVKTWSVPN